MLGKYSRSETLEIVRLPKSLTNDEAEKKVCQIFWSLDFNVDKEDLNVFHWLKDKEPVIVKFCRKKECEKVLKAKNDLQKLDATNLDLPKRLQILLNIKLLGMWIVPALISICRRAHVFCLILSMPVNLQQYRGETGAFYNCFSKIAFVTATDLIIS